MALGRRSVVSGDIEKRIITGIITNDNFCGHIAKTAKKEYFKIEFSHHVFDWCVDYFKRFKKAPGIEIQNIFSVEQGNLSEADASLTKTFLSNLSHDYETSDKYNYELLKDQARDYFRGRALDTLADRIKGDIARGRIDQAEDYVRNFNKISKDIGAWFNPFDLDSIEEVFESDEANRLFKLPGHLGEMAGYFERDWLIAFMAPMKRGKCIAAGSKVPLTDGRLKRIEDIVADNDRNILTLNHKKKIIAGESIDWIESGLKQCYLVRTKSGREIELPLDDPLLTVYGWRKLSDLKKGDFIASAKCLSFFGEKEWPKYKSRLLGYLLADGCLGDISFTKREKVLRSDFEFCVNSMGDIVTWTPDGTSGAIVKEFDKYNGKKTKTRIWLESIGVGRELSKRKVLPEEVMMLNKKSLSEFLKTLFSCDGSIYLDKKGRVEIEYSSASKELLFQVSHLLLRFGIVGKVTSNEDNKFPSWGLSIRNKVGVSSFIDQIGFIGEKHNKTILWKPNLDKIKTGRDFLTNFPSCFSKHVISPLLKKYIEKNGSRDRSWWASSGIGNLEQSLRIGTALTIGIVKEIAEKIQSKELMEYVDSDIFWDKIVEIRDVGYQQTYDLSVPIHHNFIANDIVVHNSWWLQELVIHALENGLKVAYFSFEMSKNAISKRIYKRLTALASTSGSHKFPVFDCQRNQDGSCKREDRACYKAIKAPGMPTPEFKTVKGYKPCSVCRNDEKGNYEIATWWKIQNQSRDLDSRAVARKVKNFKVLYGDNLRIMAYPAFSASFDDAERDLDELEAQEEFIPDLIAYDYFDISNPGKGASGFSERGVADYVWKRGKGQASKRHCLVATVLQSTRKSISKKSLEQEDTAEDIRKLAHVDELFGVNQTPEEKEQGMSRIGMIAHRHEEFRYVGEVMVLQSLALGQPSLDDEAIKII